ncbi:MAG: RIP metalloprotease RseP [Flavobacteriales bacterium]|nr:RIP metalloprotease RseP [Flavobacteriales bacterium]|tara:strand:- start:8243 stop:9559 length:1317 start_codon:yes stop_codon:yes gene_type:complete
MEIIIKAGQLLLSLSILVILHELGHYIPAKIFKARVEKFYLFFDPWFSLFKKKIGDTVYGIGWLPLGGYVKISGMIDESMDKEQMKKPPQPWEFRSKPAWQRLIIMVGGVVVNFILAIIIYSAVFFVWGKATLPIEEINRHGVEVTSVGKQIGFKNGDKLISVENVAVSDFSEFRNSLILEMPSFVRVSRNGNLIDIPITKQHIKTLISKKQSHLLPRRFFVVDSVPASSSSYAVFSKNDSLVGANGSRLKYADQFKDVFLKNASSPVSIEFYRNGKLLTDTVIPNSSGLIGVYQKASFAAKSSHVSFGFFESFSVGLFHSFDVGLKYLKQFNLIFDKEIKGYEGVGGFISIGSIFPEIWNWQAFWMLTAFLSIMLGVLNLLPIPALDGGHVMFLLYEVITQRKPNEKVMEFAQTIGIILLLGLVLYANGNDIFKLLS